MGFVKKTNLNLEIKFYINSTRFQAHWTSILNKENAHKSSILLFKQFISQVLKKYVLSKSELTHTGIRRSFLQCSRQNQCFRLAGGHRASLGSYPFERKSTSCFKSMKFIIQNN
jgi:hypothetical protein